VRFRGSRAADDSPDRASGDVGAGFRPLRRRKRVGSKKFTWPPAALPSLSRFRCSHTRVSPPAAPWVSGHLHLVPHALTSPRRTRHERAPLTRASKCRAARVAESVFKNPSLRTPAHPPGCHSEARASRSPFSHQRLQGRGIYRRIAEGQTRQPALDSRSRRRPDRASAGAMRRSTSSRR
jgi:hypothetical protein